MPDFEFNRNQTVNQVRALQDTTQRRDGITVDPGETAAPAGRKRSLEHAVRCAQIAEEYRGRETLVLDLTSVTPIIDYFVITTANSKRQMTAIADEVDRVLKSEGSRRMGREGRESATWVLHDYGDVVLHIFTPETREAYDLENLWADAKRIDWKEAKPESPT